jgi:hypothetical protein
MLWSSSAAEVWIHRDFPFLKQPLRNVAAVLVALTPVTKLPRTGASFSRESQSSDLLFELGKDSGNGRTWPSPVWISASVSHGWKGCSQDHMMILRSAGFRSYAPVEERFLSPHTANPILGPVQRAAGSL